MTKKETKYAWIQLRTNAPASINLLNDDEGNDGWLDGFEWGVYTIKNNMIDRLYLADTWKEAKQFLEKEGYDYYDDDPSEELYKALKT